MSLYLDGCSCAGTAPCAVPKLTCQLAAGCIDIVTARNHGPLLRVLRNHGVRLPEKSAGYSVVDLDAFRKTIDSSSNLYRGWPVLSVAALLGEDRIVSGLLKQGADVNERDDSGYTALHRAAGKGNIGALEALIAAGAGIDAVSDSGETAWRLGHVRASDTGIRFQREGALIDV